MSDRPLRRAPTITEIARELGISPSTVSRAFTAPRLLRPETVERVTRTAAALGYVPNAHARALSTGLQHTIGVVVPDIANPFFPPLLRAAQRRAEDLGYAVISADSDGDPARELRLVQRLAPQVQGLVVVGPRAPEREVALVAQRQRVLFVNRDVSGTPRVLASAGRALRDGVAHLLTAGHRRFAYVGGPRLAWAQEERLRTVREALAGGVERLVLVETTGGTYAEAVALGPSLAAAEVTAVVAFDDVVAHGVVDSLVAQGLDVPRDVSVLGCDDTIAVTTHPRSPASRCRSRRRGGSPSTC
ncbi:LacI family DNA-binding transcriptional regulator [Litorihabitans aurantiacus]|uniref:LacI family transcriptional regulator n=1 Tax=Litorihabitans aurantiacus TaxID=1930061 RepID=A0AA37UIQ8_9MICO|nr:LacI family DNA-binding transcriptional regulator [Litorihabitans aurantiacus]GMA31224.1 LacI family transcriptional regulator [Litorihabitans aurantiacus]